MKLRLFLPYSNARRLRAFGGASAVALTVLAALACGPVSQLLLFAEITPASAAPRRASGPQYQIILASSYPVLPQKSDSSKSPKDAKPKSTEQSKAPRLLKPVADHWEAGARVQLDAAETAPPVRVLTAPSSALQALPEAGDTSYQFQRLAVPRARGPPAAV